MTIEQLLIKDEGFKPYAYRDTKGFLTIGYGQLIDEKAGGRISKAAALFMMDERISEITETLKCKLPFWVQLSDTRRTALVAIAYQLGVEGLMEFQKAIAALQREDYQTAANEFRNSKWRRIDSPARAERIATAIESNFLE